MTALALAGLLLAVTTEPVPPRQRLDDTVRPLRYAAELTIVPTQDTFTGRIAIDVLAREPHAVLWLNARELTLSSARASHDGREITASVIAGPAGFVGLAFAPPLPAGTSRVEIEYSGVLSSKDWSGAFRQREKGEWYVFTQFEPLDARRVFPCFDEPAFKAPWQLTFNVRRGDHALGNAPVASEEESGAEMKRVVLAESKPLPSYAVAFAIGPFDTVDAGRSAAGVPIRIVTPRGLAGEARWIAEIPAPILAWLEAYFGSRYPYEKLDFVAIPLINVAMENPGLVTFGTRRILSRPQQESVQWRRSSASVTAHELAHMWFGDLVTMEWWDDLWLNEAFATWMASKTMESWRPGLGVEEARAKSRETAMEADSLTTARRIRQPIGSDDDIANAFDSITYQKGAQVIRMFERAIGEEVFQRGVRRHLEAHPYGNATAKDFLAKIAAAAGRDIAVDFATFLDQPGVPLVSMDLRCEPGAKPEVQLRQERYLPLGAEADAASRTATWNIPLCVRWGAGKETGRACTMLSAREGRLSLADAPACPDWLAPNEEGAGYYRAALTGEHRDALFRQATRVLSVPERIALVGDLGALARAGRVPFGDALTLVRHLTTDPSPPVVQATLALTGELRERRLVARDAVPAYARFIRDTYGRRAHELGWKPHDGEDDDTRVLRETLVPLVAEEGEDGALQAEARRLASAWRGDRRAVAPEVVEAVLRVAARTGNRALFDDWQAAARQEHHAADRRRLLKAMGSFRDPAVVPRALALALGSEFDARESWTVVTAAADVPENQTKVYALVKESFDALVEKLPRDTAATFPSFAADLCDGPTAADVSSFFKERAPRFAGGPRKLAQALEELQLCVALRDAQGPSVARFLETYATATPSGASLP